VATAEFGGSLVGQNDLTVFLAPVINVPDRVSINEQPIVRVDNFQDQYRIVLSDSNIATISYQMKLTPRRFGKVSIQIIDISRSNSLIAEKEIEIVK